MLLNLLSNAVKFTQVGSIEIAASMRSKADDGRVLLSMAVVDTGIGIAEEEFERVFDAFEQADGGKGKSDGTGLGLAISRKYARLMGGDIEVTSHLGKGSTFTFTFEAHLTDAAAAKGEELPSRVTGLAEGQPTTRVLVVDDRDHNRDILVKLLEPLGFEVETAEDGAEGVEAFKRFAPHLVLMDIRMPVMDGVAASREIRDLPGGDDVAIIAISASAMEEQRVAVLERGADGFVRKPFRDTELFSAIATHAGVIFTYEDEDVTNDHGGEVDRDLTPDALALLPTELLRKIVDATRDGDISELETLVASVKSRDASVGAAMGALVADFDYARVLKIVTPLIEDGEVGTSRSS